MSKNVVSSPVDLFVERIVLFFRLLGLVPVFVEVPKPVKLVKKLARPMKVEGVKTVLEKILKRPRREGPKAASPAVKSMTIPELGEKVWSFMRRHRRPMNRQVISGHLGHKVSAKRINACLKHLKRRGKATDRLVTNGAGRPAVLWAVKP